MEFKTDPIQIDLVSVMNLKSLNWILPKKFSIYQFWDRPKINPLDQLPPLNVIIWHFNYSSVSKYFNYCCVVSKYLLPTKQKSWLHHLRQVSDTKVYKFNILQNIVFLVNMNTSMYIYKGKFTNCTLYIRYIYNLHTKFSKLKIF